MGSIHATQEKLVPRPRKDWLSAILYQRHAENDGPKLDSLLTSEVARGMTGDFATVRADLQGHVGRGSPPVTVEG